MLSAPLANTLSTLHSTGFHPGSGAPGAKSRVRSCGSQGSGVNNTNIVSIVGKKSLLMATNSTSIKTCTDERDRRDIKKSWHWKEYFPLRLEWEESYLGENKRVYISLTIQLLLYHFPLLSKFLEKLIYYGDKLIPVHFCRVACWSRFFFQRLADELYRNQLSSFFVCLLSIWSSNTLRQWHEFCSEREPSIL